MSKKARQYIGIVVSLLSYYLVHEGAHFLYAKLSGVYKAVNVIGFVGVQVDIFRERMSDQELGMFCLVGPLATLLVSWMLAAMSDRICQISNKPLKASLWYVSLTLLILDPLYLSILYRFVGGGDMNGIKLLVPELAAEAGFAFLLILHIILIAKVLLPKYRKSFQDD